MVSIPLGEGVGMRGEIPCSMGGAEDSSPEAGDRDPLDDEVEDAERGERGDDFPLGEDEEMGEEEEGLAGVTDRERLVKLEGLVRGLTGMVKLLLADRGLAGWE